MSNLAPQEVIEKKIYLIRGHKVMLDRDLSGLYGVPTKVLNQAVQRNFKRFPEDFMFRLTLEEAHSLRSQFGDGLINSVEKYTCNAFFFVDGISLLWDNSHPWTQNKRNPTVVMLRYIGMAIEDDNALLASEHGQFALRNEDVRPFVHPTMS
jgi:hypothetical protein